MDAISKNSAKQFIENFRNASLSKRTNSHGANVANHSVGFGHASFDNDPTRKAILISMLPVGMSLNTLALNFEDTNFRVLVYPGLENNLTTRADIIFYTYKNNSIKTKQYFKVTEGLLDFDKLFNTTIKMAYSWICNPNCPQKFQDDI